MEFIARLAGASALVSVHTHNERSTVSTIVPPAVCTAAGWPLPEGPRPVGEAEEAPAEGAP
mgnify:CR=1 FL=1